MSDQEAEYTIGLGKLMAMFFGLVVLCAGFFVTGYSMGKNAAPASSTLTAMPSSVAVPAAAAPKPAAVQLAASEPDCAQSAQGCDATDANDATDGNNYNYADTTAATARTAPAPNAAAPLVIDGSRQARPPAPGLSRQARLAPAPAAAPAGTYLVQVAAVSKQQDAKALVAALRRKQYQVFIATQASDPLYHVQIGPFTDAKQADSVLTRLMADGYTPIVKQ